MILSGISDLDALNAELQWAIFGTRGLLRFIALESAPVVYSLCVTPNLGGVLSVAPPGSRG